MNTIKIQSIALKLCLVIVTISFFSHNAQASSIVEVYNNSNRVRSGIAMGGIGTGGIELRKDGNFYNWSIFNNFPKGTGPILEFPGIAKNHIDDSFLFFLVRYQIEGEQPQLKLLQINNSLQEGAMESIIYYYPWMSAIEKIEYSARFPFTTLRFSDNEMPFVIEMEAFSPFVPHDIKNSSLPGIYFNFNITSTTNKNVDIMLLGSLRNLVGYDTPEKAFVSELIVKDNYKFFSQTVSGMDTTKSTYGNMGLGVIGGNEVSYYLGWEHKHPYYERLLVETKLANIDDTKSRNKPNKDGKLIAQFASSKDQRCFGSIAVSKKLSSKGSFSTSFFMNWDFPNNMGGIDYSKNLAQADTIKTVFLNNIKPTKPIGHYYQNYFKNIYEISEYFAANKNILKANSKQFIDDMYSSDIDEFVLNQVNSQLNTFITSTVLTRDGKFGIREGMTEGMSWGPNSTIDVSLYASPMIVALFPELQKSMMLAHAKLQTTEGEINHGLAFDLDYNKNGTWGVYERVDLVPNYIQLVLRDYFWTNDKEYLKVIWPTVVKGIDYILKHRDLNGNSMPDMHGIMCSYDNFPMYGLASYIQSQWISALSMATIVARELGDKKLEKQYANIAKKGLELMESKLWNGSYYNLSNDYTGDKGIDDGCLTDQLIGQWVAYNAGIGRIFNEERVQKSLTTIMDKSFMNNSFLRNCSWPAHPDLFPIHTTNLWVDQANTPWTGVELAFASFLIYENKVEDALKVIKGVDDRYRKAGLYFDHQEFGGHYYRPMSAWSIMNAFLGYSVNKTTFNFSPKIKKSTFRMFFAAPQGTAIFSKSDSEIKIESRTGHFVFSTLIFENSKISNNKPQLYIDNKAVKNARISSKDNKYIVQLPNSTSIKKGQTVSLK